MRVLAAVALAVCLLLAGCAAKRRPGINYEVGPECHPAIRLVDCDQSSPPHCRGIRVKFDQHCERLTLKSPAAR